MVKMRRSRSIEPRQHHVPVLGSRWSCLRWHLPRRRESRDGSGLLRSLYLEMRMLGGSIAHRMEAMDGDWGPETGLVVDERGDCVVFLLHPSSSAVVRTHCRLIQYSRVDIRRTGQTYSSLILPLKPIGILTISCFRCAFAARTMKRGRCADKLMRRGRNPQHVLYRME